MEPRRIERYFRLLRLLNIAFERRLDTLGAFWFSPLAVGDRPSTEKLPTRVGRSECTERRTSRSPCANSGDTFVEGPPVRFTSPVSRRAPLSGPAITCASGPCFSSCPWSACAAGASEAPGARLEGFHHPARRQEARHHPEARQKLHLVRLRLPSERGRPSRHTFAGCRTSGCRCSCGSSCR